MSSDLLKINKFQFKIHTKESGVP